MKLLITTQVVDKNDPILGFFHGWLLEFAKHFAEVHVICLKKGSYDLPSHVYVYSLGKEEGESRSKYLYRYYTFFARIFFRVKVDFVFFHMAEIYTILAAPFFFLRKIYNTKFYWWKTHGHLNKKAKIALLVVDRVYTAIEESFPTTNPKRHVVGHAINTEKFSFSPSTNRHELLFVGRLSPSKRVEQTLDILHELQRRRYNATLKIVGAVADLQYAETLKEKVVAYKLQDRVSFVGAVRHDQLPRIYSKSTFFVNPSDNDGLDKVVLEAMAVGCIPLTANLSFFQILEPYGLYMKKGDIVGYVDKIESLLHLPQEELYQLSTFLREIVVNKHSITTLNQRIFGF